MRLMYNNFVDYAATVITAATAAADLPVSNVQHPHRGKVYRTGTSGASEYVRFDLGGVQAVQAVILLDHTLTSGDSSIRLQGGAAPGATTVNEAMTFHAGTMALFLSVPTAAYQYWQVVFTKSAAGETRDIGRIFLGTLVECTKSFQHGSPEITPVDLSETDRSLGGQTFSDIKASYDEIKGEFYWIAAAQGTALKTLADTVGTHTPFFLSVDPTNKPYDLLYYGKFSKLSAHKIEMAGSAYRWSVGFEMNEEV